MKRGVLNAMLAAAIAAALWLTASGMFVPLKVSSHQSAIRVAAVQGGGGGVSLPIPMVQADTSGSVGVGAANVVYSIDMAVAGYPDTLGALVVTVPTYDGTTIQLIKDYSAAGAAVLTATSAGTVSMLAGAHWEFPMGLRLARTNPTLVFGYYRRLGDVTNGGNPSGPSGTPPTGPVHCMVTYRTEAHYE